MGKLESNKKKKEDALYNTAFELFTTKGTNKTTISDIVEKAGVAKGTFYLYFKDKYDIRNKLVSHEASKLFKNAVSALELHIKEQQINDHSFTITFTEEIIFIADHIINVLNTNQTLLTFISKNLSWGIFKEALTTNVADDDINFKDIYYEMLEDSGLNLNEPEIMLFMIVELISSTCYSSILYKEPADIDRLKPYLYKAIKAIINEHTIEDQKIRNPLPYQKYYLTKKGICTTPPIILKFTLKFILAKTLF